jgi:hypothetical protein
MKTYTPIGTGRDGGNEEESEEDGYVTAEDEDGDGVESPDKNGKRRTSASASKIGSSNGTRTNISPTINTNTTPQSAPGSSKPSPSTPTTTTPTSIYGLKGLMGRMKL